MKTQRAHWGLTLFLFTFNSVFVCKLGKYLTLQSNTRRLASSCHKSVWRGQINIASREKVNCDNQSVRISRYNGNRMEANTCRALRTEKLKAKTGIMEWDRDNQVYIFNCVNVWHTLYLHVTQLVRNFHLIAHSLVSSNLNSIHLEPDFKYRCTCIEVQVVRDALNTEGQMY